MRQAAWLLALLVTLSITAGCDDPKETTHIDNQIRTVTLYSGGRAVRSWQVKGRLYGWGNTTIFYEAETDRRVTLEPSAHDTLIID